MSSVRAALTQLMMWCDRSSSLLMRCIFVHLCICTFIHLYICTFVYLYICTFVHLYIYTFVTCAQMQGTTSNNYQVTVTVYRMHPLSFTIICKRLLFHPAFSVHILSFFHRPLYTSPVYTPSFNYHNMYTSPRPTSLSIYPNLQAWGSMSF